MPSSSSSTAVPEEIEQWLVLGKQALWVEDFSGTCQRECFCASCFHAFCTHCCWFHHEPTIHMVFPVAADAAGRGVYATHGPDGCRVHPDFVEDVLAAQDYATRLPWDAFCLLCGTAFAAAACPDHHRHHHDPSLPDAVLRVERRGGRHCVRCTGSEWWADLMGVVLGDPVLTGVDEEGAYYELLPVLKATESKCLRCGDDMEGKLRIGFYCSLDCFREDQRTIEERRQRRVAMHAARHSGNN